MKKVQSDGFSVVEVLLLVAVAGIIGFAGWWVVRARGNAVRSLDKAVVGAGNTQKQTAKTSTDTQAAAQPQPKPVPVTTAGEHSFAFASHKLYYTLPAGWTAEESAYTTTNGIGSGTIWLKSSDYKLADDPNGGECATTSSGVEMYISASTTDLSLDAMIDSVMHPAKDSTEATFTRQPTAASLGGQKAVQYQQTPGECGWRIMTATVYGGHDLQVGTAVTTNTPPYISAPYDASYKALVASIRFE